LNAAPSTPTRDRRQTMALRQMSHRQKRKVFEDLWQEREGVAFNISINFGETKFVSLEGIEKIIGDAVNAVCIISSISMDDEDQVRVQGKVCTKSKNMHVNLEDELVSSIHHGRMHSALKKSLRLSKTPNLRVYHIDLTAAEHPRGRPGAKSIVEELKRDANYQDSILQLTISNPRHVNTVLKVIKEGGLYASPAQSSDAKTVLTVQGSFLNILKMRMKVSNMNFEGLIFDDYITVGVEPIVDIGQALE